MTLVCKVSKDRNTRQLYLPYNWAHAGRPGTELMGALPSSAEEVHDIHDWLGFIRSQWQKYKIDWISHCRVCSWTIPVTLDMSFSLQIMQIFNFSYLHSNTFLLIAIIAQDYFNIHFLCPQKIRNLTLCMVLAVSFFLWESIVIQNKFHTFKVAEKRVFQYNIKAMSGR